MKFVKYITFALALIFAISCTKHQIEYKTEVLSKDMAEFQLHYFEPITNTAANYVDSVFVNDILYSSVNGSGQLATYNGVPGGTMGSFFSIKAGTVNIKFFRKDKLIYDQNTTLVPGKQNVFVHNLKDVPVVIDNLYPYIPKGVAMGTPATHDTDSVTYIRFYNFLYEDATTPYAGKIQYQYQDVRTKEWVNLGAAVGFGEATERVAVKVVKTTHNSSGSCRVDYRMLDESGAILQVANSSGRMVNYSDYWTAYIGRAYMHIYAGVRTKAPVSSVRQWRSL